MDDEKPNKKRKASQMNARITYHAPSKVFERVFKESSLEETKQLVRRKLALNSASHVQLAQMRDNALIVLEDEDDFLAFQVAVQSNPLVNVQVTVSEEEAFQSASNKKRRKDDTKNSSETGPVISIPSAYAIAPTPLSDVEVPTTAAPGAVVISDEQPKKVKPKRVRKKSAAPTEPMSPTALKTAIEILKRHEESVAAKAGKQPKKGKHSMDSTTLSLDNIPPENDNKISSEEPDNIILSVAKSPFSSNLKKNNKSEPTKQAKPTQLAEIPADDGDSQSESQNVPAVLPKCSICGANFHARSKCPILGGNSGLLQSRLEELKENGQLDLAKEIEDHVVVERRRKQLRAATGPPRSANAKKKLPGIHDSKHVARVSQVVVETPGEGSDSDSSSDNGSKPPISNHTTMSPELSAVHKPTNTASNTRNGRANGILRKPGKDEDPTVTTESLTRDVASESEGSIPKHPQDMHRGALSPDPASNVTPKTYKATSPLTSSQGLLPRLSAFSMNGMRAAASNIFKATPKMSSSSSQPSGPIDSDSSTSDSSEEEARVPPSQRAGSQLSMLPRKSILSQF